MTDDNKTEHDQPGTEPEVSPEHASAGSEKPAAYSAENAAPAADKPHSDTPDAKEPVRDQPAAAAPATKQSKHKRHFPWFGLFLLILILPTMAAVGWLGWQGDLYIKGDSAKYSKVESLENQLHQQAQQLTAINQGLAESLAAAKASNERANERLQVLEQRVIAQNKRLLAMSTVTREDWLLAEAEYLLKLANQRILIERSAEGAEALLTEADAIMRDLADPDLYPLRKAINNDLAALRLVQKVDVEGIYLAIDGLINNIERLPMQPTRQQVMIEQESAEQTVSESEPVSGWRGKIQSSFTTFTEGLSEYIRVRDHSVKARALLAPDAARYLQHNIQLLLERAQLSLLREQPEIYTQSLLQAESYIGKYVPVSSAADNFRTQLKVLSANNIVTELPDISPSLELLHTYIEELHNLKGAKPAAGDSQP